MAGYARDYNLTHSSVLDYRSKGSVRGYSAGLYATWFADDIGQKGAYIDSWAQYSWFKNSVKGDHSPMNPIARKVQPSRWKRVTVLP
ncbi:autotransporter outer membrane beta-barrel domain-containing protein [Shigella boydii]